MAENKYEGAQLVECHQCHRKWPEGCEQARCIAGHDECIPCHFGPNGKGTSEEFEAMFPMIPKPTPSQSNGGAE